MPIITFDGVSKWYGNVIGLNKLTLRIPAGVTGLLGPNGAGKSTLLQRATGQLRPSQGTVRVLGKTPWNNPALMRHVGLCPEQDAFWEWMTGIVQDEVEEQTLTYLLLRPLPRWALYITKLVMAWLTTFVLTGVFTTLTLVVIYWDTPELWRDVLPGRAAKIAAVMALAQAAYCALFGVLGLLTRRSLIGGLVYIIAFGLLANFDAVFRRLTVLYYFRVLSVRWLDLPLSKEWSLDLTAAPSVRECIVTLLTASAVLVLWGALMTMRREFRMKTAAGS